MKTTIYHIYLGLATLVGLIVTIIFTGMLFSTLLERALISDEAYIANRGYEIQNCSQATPASLDTNGKVLTQGKSPTRAEIEKCQGEIRSRLILSRSYESAQTLINGIIYGFIGLIVFSGHLIIFRRSIRVER